MKIEHIALYVNDLEKMRTFYDNLLSGGQQDKIP